MFTLFHSLFRNQKTTYPHGLALLLKDLQGSQAVQVVLPCAVIQNLFGAVYKTAEAVALAVWPPLDAILAAHPFQGGHSQTQLGRSILHMHAEAGVMFCGRTEQWSADPEVFCTCKTKLC